MMFMFVGYFSDRMQNLIYLILSPKQLSGEQSVVVYLIAFNYAHLFEPTPQKTVPIIRALVVVKNILTALYVGLLQ